MILIINDFAKKPGIADQIQDYQGKIRKAQLLELFRRIRLSN